MLASISSRRQGCRLRREGRGGCGVGALVCPSAYIRIMSKSALDSHDDYAAQLRARVVDSGVIERELRVGALNRGAGGPPIAEPYDSLARQVRDASSRVTDAQVVAVERAAVSEKGAFEILLASAIGAGLRRWDAAGSAIRETGDAHS